MTRLLVMPCIYVYRFFSSFFKYIILGFKYIPNLLFNKKNIEKIGDTVIDTPDKLQGLIENIPFIKEKKQIEEDNFAINYDTDSKETKEKHTYKYTIKNKEGKKVTGYFDAHSKVEVHSFLVSEGAEVYNIETSKWIDFTHRKKEKSVKIKTKDLIFLLAQLSTYLKAGIPLVESVKILINQFKNQSYQKILSEVVYDLSTGESFSNSLHKQGRAFPRLLINMVKTAEMTGNLPETLDDMEKYYTETESTRKAMISALLYPIIIFVVAISVGLFIMLYVVPKFVEIYDSMDNATIPAITKFVLNLSHFLTNYISIIALITLIIIFISVYAYKNNKEFRKSIQSLLMHIPAFKNIIIYNEVTMFTKTFGSLLKHEVFITDSMDILNKITNNEIYKEIIQKAINNISKGGKISDAFKNHWAFPNPAYEMIVTGEKTGKLPEMMEKVAAYYQDMHRNSISRIKTFIEPTLIILLTVMVGVIVLSIVVPMFNMYSAIQQ